MAVARGAAETRQAILQGAARVIREAGVGHLTLEAVAQEAGVSKGGLLYHFPSKDALISGMLAQLMEDFTADIARELAREPGAAPGRWLRAYVRASAAVGEADRPYLGPAGGHRHQTGAPGAGTAALRLLAGAGGSGRAPPGG
ncbi:MAG TPA: TetR/AcrR family transcriptional regulator, partial [Chloroflexota bacterium]|nr:TetR/AcrR family transcriptional regulator [Chloroflexota bacterium]